MRSDVPHARKTGPNGVHGHEASGNGYHRRRGTTFFVIQWTPVHGLYRAVDCSLVPARDGDFGLVAVRIGETVPGQRANDDAFALFRIIRDNAQTTATFLLLLFCLLYTSDAADE